MPLHQLFVFNLCIKDRRQARPETVLISNEPSCLFPSDRDDLPLVSFETFLLETWVTPPGPKDMS